MADFDEIPGLSAARERLERMSMPRSGKAAADVLFSKIIYRLFPSIRKARSAGCTWQVIAAAIRNATGTSIPEPFLERDFRKLESFPVEEILRAGKPLPSRRKKSRAPEADAPDSERRESQIVMGSANVEREFVQFLEGLGIGPALEGDILADGKKRRFRISGDKTRERNGEYCLYDDEHPAGWAKSYSAKHGVEYAVWSAGKESPADFNEEYFAQRARKAEERRAEERRKADFSAKSAEKMVCAATAVKTDHPYLKRKGICGPLPEGIGQIGSDIVVPLRDVQGQVWNRQAISPDGEKRFLPGRKRECFFEIPGDGEHAYLVEGLATGLTVHEATGGTVIVCFDCGNLQPVARALHSKYSSRMVLAADNDRQTSGNPGVRYASTLSEELEVPFVVPPFAPEEKGSDWNDFAALHGIERTAEEIGRQVDGWMADLTRRPESAVWADRDYKGKPLKTIGNVRCLFRHLGWKIRYDEVKKNAWYDIPGAYSLDNRDNAWLARVVSECYKAGFPIGKQLLELYLFEIQDDFKYNPVREWIKSIPWDGKDRFRELADSLVLADEFDPLFRDVLLKRWFVSCVAAVFAEDGQQAQFRGVLVLKGPQAIGKTKWLQGLVPEGSGWFLSGHTLDTRDKDNVAKAISHWIVELGELDATFKVQDVSRLKSFITAESDTIRLPYAPKPSKYMRRTVFCGSVNPDFYLVDTTGNSRWWSLPVQECRFAHGIDMQQLWAQVCRWYEGGERHWLERDEQSRLNELNERSEKVDPVEDLLAQLYDWDSYDEDVSDGRTVYLTTTEVLQKCRGMDRPTKQQVDIAGASLRKLTGSQPVRRGRAGARCFLVPRQTRDEREGIYLMR